MEKSTSNVLLGAAFLMATSAIGPGFLTQTTVFTGKFLASFGFVILLSVVIDIFAQLNIWRVLTVSGKRGQDVANETLPGSGYVLAFLVAAGRFARSINIDIFAEMLCERVDDPLGDASWNQYTEPTTVLVPDWRYVNEWRCCEEMLGCAGWSIRTVYVASEGVEAANSEELASILNLREQLSFDLELTFKMGDKLAFRDAGQIIAQRWNL